MLVFELLLFLLFHAVATSCIVNLRALWLLSQETQFQSAQDEIDGGLVSAFD